MGEHLRQHRRVGVIADDHGRGGVTTGGPTSDRVRFLAARNRIRTLARNAPLPVVWRELRSPVDRPASGMAVPLATVEHAARIKARLALTSDRMNRAVPKLAVFLPTVIDPDRKKLTGPDGVTALFRSLRLLRLSSFVLWVPGVRGLLAKVLFPSPVSAPPPTAPKPPAPAAAS